ncbi:MAG: thioredoxin family protein [Planctomycetaceae bacterium]
MLSKPLAVLMFLTGLIASARLGAGEYNKVLSIGDAAPAWTDLPGTDGNRHSLADLADMPVVVVVFTCASCPTAADYEERINALTAKYGGEKGRAAVVAICVNRVEEDRLPALKARAEEKSLQFTYLYDESQKIAKDYGALFTPEFFVLNQDRTIVYMGAMDDATNPQQVTKRYVEDAIEAALTGGLPEEQEVIARGCLIRYARERRKRSANDQ